MTAVIITGAVAALAVFSLIARRLWWWITTGRFIR